MIINATHPVMQFVVVEKNLCLCVHIQKANQGVSEKCDDLMNVVYQFLFNLVLIAKASNTLLLRPHTHTPQYSVAWQPFRVVIFLIIKLTSCCENTRGI